MIAFRFCGSIRAAPSGFCRAGEKNLDSKFEPVQLGIGIREGKRRDAAIPWQAEDWEEGDGKP
jgi:hypothetical protein